ncbi:hypothetical protein ACFYSJ_30590 [Streptomyces sp. NPDC005248]|uniref:hypothetical protein n=1 Tax=Streptomyces sp. NPDC005248 TaxID=3364709 RepID=UPI0036CF35BA
MNADEGDQQLQGGVALGSRGQHLDRLGAQRHGHRAGPGPQAQATCGVGEQQLLAFERLEHVPQRDGFVVRCRALGQPLGEVGAGDLAQGAVALRAVEEEWDRGVDLVADSGGRAGAAARPAVSDDADPREGFCADLRVYVAEPALDPGVQGADAVVVEEVDVGEDLGDPGDGAFGSLARQRGDRAGLDVLVRAVDGGQQIQALQHALAQGR